MYRIHLREGNDTPLHLCLDLWSPLSAASFSPFALEILTVLVVPLTQFFFPLTRRDSWGSDWVPAPNPLPVFQPHNSIGNKALLHFVFSLDLWPEMMLSF